MNAGDDMTVSHPSAARAHDTPDTQHARAARRRRRRGHSPALTCTSLSRAGVRPAKGMVAGQWQCEPLETLGVQLAHGPQYERR